MLSQDTCTLRSARADKKLMPTNIYIYDLVTPTVPYHWALEEQVQLLQDVGHGLRGLVRVALLLW
jgi:hypothetical protein